MEQENVRSEGGSTQGLMIPLEAFREHWQGHRRLTRRMIEAFPEEAFFNYSVGGMRPFAAMVMEMISMAGAGIQGVASGEWKVVGELDHHTKGTEPTTREECLRRWDEVTAQIDALWPTIKPERFQQVDRAFGMYEGPIYSTLLYFIDNEIHHRGEGYVYLRSLGIESPPFWER